jgi:prephenate dehydrogenase
VRLAANTIPRSKALKYFIFPIHPLNGTHTQSMSQLSEGLKIILQPVSSPSSTLIEVDLTSENQ